MGCCVVVAVGAVGPPSVSTVSAGLVEVRGAVTEEVEALLVLGAVVVEGAAGESRVRMSLLVVGAAAADPVLRPKDCCCGCCVEVGGADEGAVAPPRP